MVVGDDVSVSRDNHSGTGTSTVRLLVLALLWSALAVSEEVAEEFFKRIAICYLVGLAHLRNLDIYDGVYAAFGGIGKVHISALRRR